MAIASNLPNVSAEASPSYFKNYYVKQGFVSDNQYEALIGLLEKRTDNKKAAQNLAGAIIQGASQQNVKFAELYDLLRASSSVEIDAFLAFFLNNTRIGTSYLGIKNADNTNPYIVRSILV